MKTEKTFAVIFLIGLIFKYVLLWPGAGLLLTISLCSLAMLYFPGAVYFFRDKTVKGQNIILSVISGMCIALIPIGILFKIQHWPGAGFNLMMGMITSLIFLGVTYGLKSKATEELSTYYKNMLRRISVLAVLAIFFYFMPSKTLIDIQCRNNPELARLKYQSYSNPDNEEYRKQLHDYIKQQDSIEVNKHIHENKK